MRGSWLSGSTRRVSSHRPVARANAGGRPSRASSPPRPQRLPPPLLRLLLRLRLTGRLVLHSAHLAGGVRDRMARTLLPLCRGRLAFPMRQTARVTPPRLCSACDRPHAQPAGPVRNHSRSYRPALRYLLLLLLLLPVVALHSCRHLPHGMALARARQALVLVRPVQPLQRHPGHFNRPRMHTHTSEERLQPQHRRRCRQAQVHL